MFGSTSRFFKKVIVSKVYSLKWSNWNFIAIFVLRFKSPHKPISRAWALIRLVGPRENTGRFGSAIYVLTNLQLSEKSMSRPLIVHRIFCYLCVPEVLKPLCTIIQVCILGIYSYQILLNMFQNPIWRDFRAFFEKNRFF